MKAHAYIPAAADLCLRMLGTLSKIGAVNNALHYCREPWVREAARRKGALASEMVGVYDLWGEDDVTPYPAAVVRVTRTPWKLGQSLRTSYLALYFTPRREWQVVVFDGLREERRRSGWPPEP